MTIKIVATNQENAISMARLADRIVRRNYNTYGANCEYGIFWVTMNFNIEFKFDELEKENLLECIYHAWSRAIPAWNNETAWAEVE